MLRTKKTNCMKSLLLIITLLIALPASANHGVEALGGVVEYAIYAILIVILSLVLITSGILRFALNKPLFSIGVYLTGCGIVFFTLKNYFAALEDYNGRYSISDYYPGPLRESFLQTAKEQLTSAALWFYFSLVLILLYLVIDILVYRKSQKKQAEAS